MSNRDVFISYSSKDETAAHSIRNVLEKNGISCWIAPDDIPFSQDYIKSIPAAIEQSELFLLLITDNAQASKWVRLEYQRALNIGKIIIPFLMKNCPIDEAFNFVNTDANRIDAFRKKDAALEKLVYRINSLLGREPAPLNREDFAEYIRTSRSRPRLVYAVAAAVVVAAAAAALIFLIPSLQQGGEKVEQPTASAYDAEEDETAATTVIDLTDIDYSGTDGDISWGYDQDEAVLSLSGEGAIPDYRHIGETPWFRVYKDIKHIEIGGGITRIGSFAFSNLSSLESVDIPSSVTEIGDSAFLNSSLGSVSLPESLTAISDKAFFGCENLDQIVIPESVRELGESVCELSGIKSATINARLSELPKHTFFRCDELTSVKLPDSLTKIASDSIVASKLTSIEIPNSVRSIESYALYGCAFTSVTIPKNVGFIGDHAFFDCTELVEVRMLCDIDSLSEGCFSGCESLRSINIPSGVKTIGRLCFYECSSLEQIDLPSSLEAIGDNAFDSCAGLRSVSVPSSVSSIGEHSLGFQRFSNSNNSKIWYEVYDGFVLYANGNPTAVRYAQDNGIRYK